jgi:Tfp pilus assembly protein PilF
VDLLSNLIKEEPNYAPTYHLLGVAYFGRGDIPLAKSYIGRAIELKPDLLQSRLIMADISNRERDFKLAEEQSREALKLTLIVFRPK